MFLSKTLAGKILNISNILKIMNEINIRTRLLPQTNKGIDCPINSSITISFGSLSSNFFNIYFKKKMNKLL